MNQRSPIRHGFTLLELMMVVTILGAALLIVPPNLYRFGARSRLENSANTLVSTVAAAREQAIIDGHPVQLELGVYKTKNGEIHHGHRLVFTSIPTQRSDLLSRDRGEEREAPRSEEREWLYTDWHELADGVKYVGVSERSDHWMKLSEDHPYAVGFGPDGGVEKGFAVRLESVDLEVRPEHRTITVIVNPLTAEASAADGLAEVPPQRDENELSR